MNVAIIPARGGSSGIPRKNLRLLHGKSLLEHSIETALESGCVGRVLISTDDQDIARVAFRCGAEVVWRLNSISGDGSPSESALLHALEYFHRQAGCDPDLVLLLQTTSPLREASDIRKAVETLEVTGSDSLFSASALQGFLWRIENGEARSFNYDCNARPRRQDAPEDLVENGSIYVFKPWVLRTFHNRLGGKIAVYRMTSEHYFQIDEPDDLPIVEALMNARRAPHVGVDFSVVRLLVLDFDGVLTDNQVTVDEHGVEAVCFSRADGWGISQLKRGGVEVVVISTEVNPVVSVRCRKLDIGCVQGVESKQEALETLMRKAGVSRHEVVYIGNDINDIECMRMVDLPVAVADAVGQVRDVAKLVTRCPGGHGAVREICDLILQSDKGDGHVHAGENR